MKQSHIADCIEQDLPAPQRSVHTYTISGAGPKSIYIHESGPRTMSHRLIHREGIGLFRITVKGEAGAATLVFTQPIGVTWSIDILPYQDLPPPGEMMVETQNGTTYLTITSATPLELYRG